MVVDVFIKLKGLMLDTSFNLLLDSFEGKKFNSPNDVVVKSDGTIWFTDPPYGILI